MSMVPYTYLARCSYSTAGARKKFVRKVTAWTAADALTQLFIFYEDPEAPDAYLACQHLYAFSVDKIAPIADERMWVEYTSAPRDPQVNYDE